MNWNPILNWKLLNGSHRFPGPDGGTCINEAAIVAAGFKYRAVQSVDDCPPCFSRVIAGYALRLNDAMDDDLRQELLIPYVVRLAGTADMPEIEIARAKHIALETIRRILPVSLRAAGLNDYASCCADAKDLRAAYAVAKAAVYAHAAADAAHAVYAAAAADAAADDAAADAACAAAAAADDAACAAAAAADDAAYAVARAAVYAHAAAYAAKAAKAAAYAAKAAKAAAHAADADDAACAAAAADDAACAAAADARREIFTIAVAILDEAICLGKQSDPIETGVIVARMEAAKQRRKLAIPVTENV